MRNLHICLLLSVILPATFAEEPPLPDAAAEAREIYAREIERVLVPLRTKYIRALETMKRQHTREGNLEAALQVDEELNRANLWEGVPLPVAENADAEGGIAEEPKLPDDTANVRKSYAREIERVLGPLRSKYIRAVENRKNEYTSEGKLEAALQVDGELKRAKRWEGVPIPTVKIADSEKDFGNWIVGKKFSFSGIAQVTLLFGEDLVTWTTGNGMVKEHTYTIDTKRTVTVEGGQDFKMKFSDDLKSGTFSSNVGTYDLKYEN